MKHHLRLIWRTLLKNKVTSVINIVGLTLGLATAFLIGLYVLNEYQTDADIPMPERTYRVLRIGGMNNTPYRIGLTSAPFASALELDFPEEVENAIRVMPANNLVEIDGDQYQEENYLYADADFFQFFGVELLAGDPSTVLSSPNSVALTVETARRYFGNEYDALGQTVRISNNYDAQVTGIIADTGLPMHFEFDLVESALTLESTEWWQEWWNNNLCTYVRLSPGSSEAGLEAKLGGFMDKYFGADFARTGNRMELDLQPIQSVYFEADTRYDPMRHGNRQALQVFLIAVFLLVMIACFNYVNLTTARAVERSLEVGVYKVLGAGRARIMLQMIGESFIVALVSVVMACFIAWYAHPLFESIFAIDLSLVLPVWQVIALLLAGTLVLALMAGLYPGWLLSSFNIIAAMKRATLSGERGMPGLRRVLVVFQFVLSISLIAGTFIIQTQLSYLQNKDLGFDRDAVMIMWTNQDLYANRQTFSNLLEQAPGVEHVTFASGYPGGYHDATVVAFSELPDPVRMRTAFVDFDYVDTYGLNIIAGRNFSRALASDSTQAILLNEKAVEALNMTVDEVLGKQGRLIMFDNQPRTVVGIVENFHFASLHDEIEPLVISTNFEGWTIGVKADGRRLQEVVDAAEQAWATLSPAFPFEFEFLDDQLNQLYTNEARQGRLVGFFGAIAIFIACLGMFGLIAFNAALRAKEIGIRKVLGASVPDIVQLLSKDFLIQVCVAILIATPIAFFLMQRWLEAFAYKINLGPGVFLLAGGFAIVLTLLTVGYQSIKAALSNPVDTLRYE